MKIIAGIMVLLAVIYFAPAIMHMQTSHKIKGSSSEQVKKSAMQVRRTMPSNEMRVFDTAFGILERLKSQEGPKAFAEAVDGLSPDEVIELAKREVDIKIATGDPEFKQYASWDDMVAKLTADASKKGMPGQQSQHAPPLRQSERPDRPN
jgi:hypothetical protein